MSHSRWNRTGGFAGIVYVAAAATAAALTGRPPGPDASNKAVQHFVIDHPGLVVAQGWMYALATALILWFALAVRRVLYTASTNRHLGDLFLVATAAVAALSFVSMSIRIVAAKRADELSAPAVRAIGTDFSLVLLALCGFLVAVAAVAYAGCVMQGGGLPRWTAWSAIVAAVINLAGTLSVFDTGGSFSVEGGLATLLPALATAVWYLGTSVSLWMAHEEPRPQPL